jgi:hypothetical protein
MVDKKNKKDLDYSALGCFITDRVINDIQIMCDFDGSCMALPLYRISA